VTRRSPNPDMNFKACLDCALRLLVRRGYSNVELTQKLTKKGFSESDILMVMNKCRHWGYLNEIDYAQSLIRQLNRKGFGHRYIRRALHARKLPSDIIENTMQAADLDENEIACCRHALRKKIKHSDPCADPAIRKSKLYRFLFQRGFSPDIICRAIEEVSTLRE
jgi:regulatory protein